MAARSVHESPGNRSTEASQVVAVIPARHASQRLPGKPLADLEGRPLIAWVVASALRARRVGQVVVATDHPSIEAAAKEAGAEAVLTDPGHATGTDRIGQAIEGRSETIVLNVQGDEPLVMPSMIDRLVELLDSDADAMVSTLAAVCSADTATDPNVVKVVCNERGRAQYFSRAPIPGRHPGAESRAPEFLRHVGLYGFRRPALERFLAHPRSTLERAEGLEQLRFLEMGDGIVVGRIEAVAPGVDTEADLEECRRILRSRAG